MEKLAISIIVPIYNMEKYMRKCIDSILTQTFTDFECLLIDDGSTDSSPTICDEYAQKDARITVFHKPNGGLSDARNYGLERAQGEYTIFADPDDWVDAEGLDQLYKKAKETNADMVMCDLYYNDPYQQTYSRQEPTSLNHLDVLKDILLDEVQGFTVIKLIRRSLYHLYDLQYPVGMYGCEDQYTICGLLKNNIHIEYVPIAYYHYMHYGNTTQSRKYNDATYSQDLKIRDMFVGLLKDTPLGQLAYDRKSLSMLLRAFHFGENVFSGNLFKTRFSNLKPIIQQEKGLMKILLSLSVKGYYPLAKNCFNLLYNIKQICKKFKFKITQLC